MIKIYKYPLTVVDRQYVVAPFGVRLLSVGLDPVGNLCAWAATNDVDKPTQGVAIYMLGTGNNADVLSADPPKHFLGTVTMPPFVWHVFCDLEHAYARL